MRIRTHVKEHIEIDVGEFSFQIKLVERSMSITRHDYLAEYLASKGVKYDIEYHN
jgi:hypothetical protein